VTKSKDSCPNCGRPKSATAEYCIVCYNSYKELRKKGTVFPRKEVPLRPPPERRPVKYIGAQPDPALIKGAYVRYGMGVPNAYVRFLVLTRTLGYPVDWEGWLKFVYDLH
jgi:hypothetical protein